MTLRLRLVVGLVVLVLIGLATFGFSTYTLYARTQYDRLDEQLRSSIPSASCGLFSHNGAAGSQQCPGSGRGGPSAPPGTYAALVSVDGHVLFDTDGAPLEVTFGPPTTNKPSLSTIRDPGQHAALLTTGSLVGDGEWRVSVSRVGFDGPNSGVPLIIVAIPTREVTDSLRRLILIEGSAAGGLLIILAAGSWLILRQGLRPLEQMATSTRAITAGDLSQRVEPSDGRSEVGQLGLAMNTMLGELEIAFQERDATENRLRQFLADASHELRTPLTSIQGFAELFRLGAGHPDLDLATVMRRIEQESARMKVLVEDLLLLARLDQPRPTRPTSVDLAVLCADACSDAHALAPDRTVSLDAPEPVVIRGDRDHLHQAVANLVTNAVRHTPSGTAIDVSSRFVDGSAVVTVRDHGGGLDETALEHAFDRFWQADSARVGTGSGLGLAIVASIAHEHHGSVAAANAIDGGAVFTIRIPLSVTDTRPGQVEVRNEASQQIPRDNGAPTQS